MMGESKVIFESGIIIAGKRRNRSCDVTVKDDDFCVNVESSAFLCDGGSLSPSEAHALGEILIEASKFAMAARANESLSKDYQDGGK